MHQRVVILDFGAQYTQLIARRIREAGVYTEIYPCTIPVAEVDAMQAQGIVLSGGPASVYADGAPQLDPAILRLKRKDGKPMPILGICYGLQAMAHAQNAKVQRAEAREFGRAALTLIGHDPLFDGVPQQSSVWMSHGDHLTEVPQGYSLIAKTDNAPIAAVKADSVPHYGVQFHPESIKSEHGHAMLQNFLNTMSTTSKVPA